MSPMDEFVSVVCHQMRYVTNYCYKIKSMMLIRYYYLLYYSNYKIMLN